MDGRQFGPYCLVEQIAVGGMAEIHLAKTGGVAGFEKYVALKMIHPHMSNDDKFVQMLIDEAKISVQLQHPNIAHTFDLGRVGHTYYITMEYVDGADLYHVLRESADQERVMPVDIAAHIAKEVARGLDYAHRKRDVNGNPLCIVHRDVSPQNVLLSHAGEIKLVDFGIAKATMRAPTTAAGVIKGKYYYMSPEQARGETIDHRSDIFSAGILLYEMLTGQMLYLEENLDILLGMVRRADIPPPTSLRKDVPDKLERIVMRALAPAVADRYQTAGEYASDLETFLRESSPIFTASKVAAHLRAVLDDTPAPAAAAKVKPQALPRRKKRITREEIVTTGAEIEDENSVIFSIREFAQSRLRAPPGLGRTAGDDLSEPTRADPGGLAAVERLRGRQPDVHTMPAGFAAGGSIDDATDHTDDDRTIISGPPGFGDDSAALLRDLDNDDSPTVAHDPLSPDVLAAMDDGATRSESPRGIASLVSGDMAAALRARNQAPAVSELRAPPRSRRTPMAGVPLTRPPTDDDGDITTHQVGRSPSSSPAGQLPLPAPHISYAELPRPALADLSQPVAIAPGGRPPDILGKKLPRSWIIGGAIVAILIVVAAIVMSLTGDDSAPLPSSIELVSIPPGAHVTVDGAQLPAPTPATFSDAEPGKSYRVVFSLAGYQPREITIEVPATGGTVKQTVDLSPAK